METLAVYRKIAGHLLSCHFAAKIGKAIEIVNLLGMDLCMEKRGK